MLPQEIQKNGEGDAQHIVSIEEIHEMLKQGNPLRGLRFAGSKQDFPMPPKAGHLIAECRFMGDWSTLDLSDYELVDCTFRDCTISTLVPGPGKWTSVTIASSEIQTFKLKRADLTLCTFLDCTIRAMGYPTFHEFETVRNIFVNCQFRKSSLFHGNLRNTQFRDCSFEEVDFGKARLENASFPDTALIDCHLEEAQLTSKTDFSECDSMVGTRVTRSGLDAMRDFGGLSVRQRQSMKILDSIATLRHQFGGVIGAIHTMALLLFLSPYLVFVCHQYWISSLNKCTGECESILAAVGRYIYSGGTMTQDIHWWSLGLFSILLSYNIARGILLWKTIQLEHHQEVTGVPENFAFHGPWKALYETVRWTFYINLAAALGHIVHFLQREVPVI